MTDILTTLGAAQQLLIGALSDLAAQAPDSRLTDDAAFRDLAQAINGVALVRLALLNRPQETLHA